MIEYLRRKPRGNIQSTEYILSIMLVVESSIKSSLRNIRVIFRMLDSNMQPTRA